jgi:hypothetical protein
MAKRQTNKSTRSNRTVRYEKGHKVQRLLLLDKKSGRSKRDRQTLWNISMTCTLKGNASRA